MTSKVFRGTAEDLVAGARVTLSGLGSALMRASALLALAQPVVAQAMGVTPVTLVLESEGRRSSGQINVNNNDPRPLPVELTVTRLTMSSDGKISRTPAPDTFILFPPQTAIAPASTQSFRIQYAGDTNLAQSEAFEVSVDQVPVGIRPNETGAQVEIVYSIGAVVIVAPLGSVAKVSITESYPLADAKGIRHPVVVLKNDGNRHALLSEGRLSVAARNTEGKIVWQRTLTAEQIRQQVGIGYIPPHGTRKLQLPFELPESSSTVSISFKQGGS